jgi:hypothetical protein
MAGYGWMVFLQGHLLGEKAQDQITDTDISKSGTKRSI